MSKKAALVVIDVEKQVFDLPTDLGKQILGR